MCYKQFKAYTLAVELGFPFSRNIRYFGSYFLSLSLTFPSLPELIWFLFLVAVKFYDLKGK